MKVDGVSQMARLTDGEERRLKIFRHFSPSLEFNFPDLNARYACPLCLEVFDETAVLGESPALTEEHCIPGAVGNGPRVLTCGACNNDAGSKVDSQLHRRLEFESLWKGTRETPAIGRLKIGDHNLGMSLTIVGSPPRLEFHVSGRATNPAHIQAVQDSYKKGALPQEMKIEFGPTEVPDITKARMAVLKAAYLLSFSSFGYSYINAPFLNAVRELATTFNPKVVPLADIVLLCPIDTLPSGIAVITAPKELKAIAVPLSLARYDVGYVGVLPVDGTTYERWRVWRSERGVDSMNLSYRVFPTDTSILTDPEFTWRDP